MIKDKAFLDGNRPEDQQQIFKEIKKVIGVRIKDSGGLKGPDTKSLLYFLNEYVYIEDKVKKTALKLTLWLEQEKIIPDINESDLLAILKAQQLGLTWLVAAYVLWCSLVNRLFLSIIISVTEDLSIEFLDRVYFILDRLPTWLKPPIKTRTKQVLEFQHGDGLISTIKSLPTTEMGGQSKTPNLLVMDETCKNKMAQAIYNASYAGIKQAKGKIIVISNAIKEGDGWAWTRDLCISTQRKLNDFKLIFLSWRAHPGRSDNFKEECKRANMTDREIGERFPDTIEEALTDRNIKGVYYAKQMADARKEGRICSVPHSDGHEVYTFWDLGLSGIEDVMAIIFMQQIGREYRIIDYCEDFGMGLAHYAKILKNKPYVYGDHYFPHDVAKREMGGETDVALTRKETAENLGIEPIITVKKAKDTQAVMNGIEMVRNVLGQCWFDERKCAKLIIALESFRSEWDEERETLANKPLHNWAMNPADAMRCFAVGYQPKMKSMPFENTRRDYVSGGLSYLGS